MLFSAFFTPSISQVVRYATPADTLAIPNANIGDLLITGGTEISGSLPAVYLGMSSNWTILPGKKILIKGGVYDFIIIHSSSSGTSSEPIVITNYNGQVETKHMSLKGMKHFKLTGRYDPLRKTGDVNYQGHANGYAWTQGKYGIFVNNNWTSTTRFLLEITGFNNGSDVSTSNYEVEYVESGNGGYSNVFKFNDVLGVVDSVKIHDMYIHDTDGEGTYVGNTSNAAQQVFKNLQIYNNRIIRSGNDGLQVNNVVDGSSIYNNVVLNSGMGWRNPFMAWQDFGCSLSFNNVGASFKNNIIVGGSGQLYQAFLTPESSYPVPTSGSVLFTNNLFLYSKNMGVFLGPQAGNLSGVSQDIQTNIFGKFEFLYNLVYTISNSNYVYQSYYNGPVNLNGNRWDGSGGKTIFYTFLTPPATNTNNSISSVEDIVFVNYAGNGFDYNRFDKWAPFTTIGTNPGTPVTYTPGWYVMHKSKMYKCLANATNIEPGITPSWNNYWELMVFNGGTSFYPADDVRVPIGNLYNTLKMGLLDNPNGSPLPIQWISFSASKHINSVKLEWRSDFSSNLKEFVVERNIGSGFKEIGRTNLSSFEDKFPGKTNQYRIKAVLFGESISYSQIKQINFTTNIFTQRIVVYNTLGQIVLRAENMESVIRSSLKEGIYFLLFEDRSRLKFFKNK